MGDLFRLINKPWEVRTVLTDRRARSQERLANEAALVQFWDDMKNGRIGRGCE